LLAIAHINLVLGAFDLPTILSEKHPKQSGYTFRSQATQIYLLAIAHINLVLGAFDLPTILSEKHPKQSG